MFYGIKYPDHLNSLILMNPVSASSSCRDTTTKVLQARFTLKDSIVRAQVINPKFSEIAHPKR